MPPSSASPNLLFASYDASPGTPISKTASTPSSRPHGILLRPYQ